MRLKIIAGNLVTVLLVGFVAHYLVRSQLEGTLASGLESDVTRANAQLASSFRLSALEFVEQVRERAATPQVVGAFDALDETGRRRRAFDAAETVAAWFQDPSRGRGGRPDIVVLTDNTGRVVARDTDSNRMFGQSLAQSVPAVGEALRSGVATHDAWRYGDDDKVLATAVAPITSGGSVLGTLVVAYDVSNGFLQTEARALDAEVATLLQGRVYSWSTADQAVGSALPGVLLRDQRDATTSALGGATSAAWSASIGDRDYVGITSPLPMMRSVPMAYAVLVDRTAAIAPASVANVILWITLFGAVLVIVYGFIIANGLIDPLEQIEEGVLAVINGRQDVRLEVDSPELGGLAYRINQLINVFTGVPEGDAPSDGAAWGMGAAGPSLPPGPMGGSPLLGVALPPGGANDPVDDPAIASALATESEDAYLARVYAEYVEQKRAVGEDVSNIPQERFAQRLRGNADALSQKHGVAKVRFAVQSDGAHVVLRPVLIR